LRQLLRSAVALLPPRISRSFSFFLDPNLWLAGHLHYPMSKPGNLTLEARFWPADRDALRRFLPSN